MMRYVMLAVAAMYAAPAFAVETGNGAQSGGHYNLNILGKENCAGDDLVDTNRHNIQVKLNFVTNIDGQVWAVADKTNVIKLTEGDFQVIDGNACDRGGALFSLPANFECPDADGDGYADPFCAEPDLTNQQYVVYARAVSKPGGKAVMTTCTTAAGLDGVLDTADDTVLCSTENTVNALRRANGKPSFSNVTKELTTVLYDFDQDGDLDRMPIFADDNRDYLWTYDNYGLRTAQLRFYPIPD